MRNYEIAMNPNPLVRYLKKPASEFKREDIIRYIEKNDIQMLNFRYVAEDGKLKTLNFVITSKDYLVLYKSVWVAQRKNIYICPKKEI